MDLLAPLTDLFKTAEDPLDALETLAKRPTPEPEPVQDEADWLAGAPWDPTIEIDIELTRLGDPDLIAKQAEAVEAHRNR